MNEFLEDQEGRSEMKNRRKKFTFAPAGSLFAAALSLSWLGGSTTWLMAQVPADAPIRAVVQDVVVPDDSPDESRDPQIEEPPAIEETVVPARPDPFPANPLPSDTVVTATSSATRLEQVGSSVTVVTGESIRRAGFRNAAEALRTVAGVNVARQGNFGGLTSVFMRGANSQHTKVLLDGIPLNDPSSAARAFDFSLLTVDEIERIEIVRGPQSVLYGSDAIGGVINIITKRGDGPVQTRVGLEGGSYGTGRGTFHMSGGGNRAYFSIGGSYWDTSGFSSAAARNGNLEADGYQNGTLSGRFGWTPTEWLNVDYVVRYVDADVAIDDFDFGSGLPIDNLIRRNLTNTLWHRVQAQSLLWDGTVDQRIGLSIADYRRRDTDPGLFVPPLFEGQSRTVDWQASLLVSHNNVLTVGAVYYHEEALSSFQPQVSQNQLSGYIEDQFQVGDRWYGTIGVRWEDHSKAGTAQTYRFTNRIPVDSLGASVHGSIGTGFRAPSLAENLFQFGNPNLRPEFSKGWDVGWQQSFLEDRFVVDATYYRNDFVDLIIFDFNTFSLQNVGRSRSHGVEVTAKWQPNLCWRVSGAYTYDDTVDLDRDRQLYRRPRNSTSLTIERLFDRGVLRLDTIFVGKRLDTRDITLDSYVLVNASGSYDFSDKWSLYGRVDNLLDQQYEEIRGYGVPALSGYAGIQYRR